MILALHSPDNFNGMLQRWKENGILYARDIIRNSREEIDYNMRIGENSSKQAYGQVDKQGRMQGLGREANDFLYEGQFKDNIYHGWGRYISHLGTYWGFYENGLRHG